MKTYIKQHILLLLALLAIATTRAFGAETRTTLWSNYSPNGSTFSKTESIDFSSGDYIEAEIDLTNCGTSVSLQNLISFGDDIANWNTGAYNLHLYYTHSSKSLVIDYLTAGGTKQETTTTLSSTTLKLKLSSEGLSVNGTTTVDASTLSGLLTLTSIQVGSAQGDNHSYATYNDVSIVGEGSGSSGGESTSTFVVPSYGSNYYICTATDATKCFTVTTTENDETIKVSDKTNASGQQWTVKQGNYSTSYPYHFVSVLSGKAIDMAGTSTSSAPLQWTSENDYNGGEANLNQEWNIASTGNGDNTYYIYCKPQGSSSTYYLAINSAGTGLTKVTSQSSATAFGFIAVDGSGTTTPDTPSRTFQYSWVHTPTKFSDNKEDAHATFIPYASTSDMKADATYDQPWLTPTKAMTMNLNGTWKFHYESSGGSAAPSTTYTSNDASTSSWDEIRVPLSWEMAGYDTPVYTNEGSGGYPFTANTSTWSTVAQSRSNCDTNPLGYYRRTFTLPEGWSDKRVMVHFDGAYSAIAVYVNGNYVGYSEGANTDAEFDITSFVNATAENNITVACYRWSAGSYLEGQDMWHLGGIHRDVYLVAMPKVFVNDHIIWASLSNDAATSGTLYTKVSVDNRDGENTSKTISVKLLDKDGKQVGSTATYDYSGSTSVSEKQLSFANLSNLHPWSSEDPYLYTVEYSQKDANGNEEMAFSTKFGFRNITKSGNLVYVNGKRAYFKGVNTQDTHPLYGRAIDMETMLKDVTLMKQANVNMIRTSHYPRQPKMYAMMDAFGLYCMDEADIECHPLQSVASNSQFANNMLDRVTRMFKRDRNHPSVIFWSLGNESGTASNQSSCYSYIKNNDNRLVHYEPNSTYSDLGSNMYPSVDGVSGNSSGLNSKPYFICEYAHAMGNAMGRLKDYWNVIEGSTGIIGGCIWDWVDQSIYDPQKAKNVINGTAEASTLVNANGFNYWKQGYDFQTPSGDYEATYMGAFMDNGIVTPDRKWSSKLTEVKKVYQNVDFTSLSGHTLTLKNKNLFTNLDAYTLVYRVLANGNVVEEGSADVPSIAVGSTGTMNVPYTYSAKSGEEVLLNVALVTKDAALWADKGYDVADEQFTIQSRGSLSSHTGTGSLTVSNNTVSGSGWSMTFNSNGSLSSWKYNNQDILTSAPAFSQYFSIDNSRNGCPYNTGSSNTYSVSSSLKNNSDGTATITVSGSSDRNYSIAYTIYPDGVVDMKVNFNSGSQTYRVGLAMQFGSGFEGVEYYGRGPWANYPDRKTGSYLGRYATCVDDLFEEYTHPQTNGDHLNLRDLTLTAPNVALKIETEGDVSFSMSHYQESYWSAKTWRTKKHNDEMTRQGSVYAHFDAAISGVGNGSCGESTPSQYLPSTSAYSYTLRFTPKSLK